MRCGLLTVFARQQAEVEEADGVVTVDVDAAKARAVLVVFAREQAEVEESYGTILVNVRSEIDAGTVCAIAFWCAGGVFGEDDTINDDAIGVTDQLERVAARCQVDVDEATAGCFCDPV